MTVQLILTFALPILSGGMLVHVIWPDRSFWPMALKVFLGAGVGLGATSLLYFVFLLFFAGQNWFIALQAAALLALTMIAGLQARRSSTSGRWFGGVPRLTRLQEIEVGIGLLVLVISFLSTANYLLRRRQGDWDAWMMYNRAARFAYLDQTHWLGSFSPQMDPLFHADYPLLLAMNITSGWQLMGRDNPRVPMVQSAIFALACLGLVVSSLAAAKSVGQAALGLVFLWGVPEFVNEGARQMADVPLALFITATGVLLYFYAVQRSSGLLVLAGLSAGLAAWTKNEGAVLVIGAAAGVAVAFARDRSLRPLSLLALGLLAPLAIVLFFKLRIAPPGDILRSGEAQALALIADPSRHASILRYFGLELLNFGNWGVPYVSLGIIPMLLIYYLLFRVGVSPEQRSGFVAIWTVLAIQMLGYYGAYLISPYELTWHLSYSSSRLVLQVFPLVLFAVLSASRDVESIFSHTTVSIPE